MEKSKAQYLEMYRMTSGKQYMTSAGLPKREWVVESIIKANSPSGVNTLNNITTLAIVKITPTTIPLADRLRERGIQII